LVSRLKGELDWIVLRAMEKDRTRRYDSPGELAADIERSLRNEPVLAGPPGVAYRTRKFVRRHRVGVVVATTAVTGLVAFAILMSVQSARIARERDRANREAQASQRVSDFLVGIFRVSDPSVSDGTKITAREVLANGAANLDKDLKTDPLIQAKLFVSVGLIYLNMGLYKDAEPMFEKSLDLRRRLLGAEHGDTLLTMHCLAATYGHLGKYDQAEKLGRETLDARRRVLGVENLYTLQTASVLSKLYTASGKPRAAAAVLDELIAARGGLPKTAGGVGVTFDALNTLAGAHVMLGQYPRAESQSRELHEQMMQKYGKESLTSLWSRNFSASACFLQGKYDEARTLYHAGFEVSRKQYGPDHKITMSLQAGLAASSFFVGSRDESMAMERQVLETARRVFGPQAAETQQQLFALGMMSLFENKYAEAEEYFRQASDGFRRLMGPVGYSTLWAENGLAAAALHNGKLDEARRILESVVDASPQALGPEHPHTRDSMRRLAEVYAAQGRDAEAEKLFNAALAEVPPETWQDPRVRSASFFGLAGLEAGQGERAQALDHLRQAIASGFDDPAALSRSSRFDSLRSDPAFTVLRAAAEANSRRPPAAPTF